MKSYKKIFDAYGVTPERVRQAGFSYQVFYYHSKGQRGMKAETALEYERVFGIPRQVLRPDLWKDANVNNEQAQNKKGEQ